jgi:hypothetical protein
MVAAGSSHSMAIGATPSPDFNSDGFTDLLWQNQATGDVTYWLMNDTTRTGYGWIAYGVPTEWKIVATIDLDNSGYSDLVWQNQITGDVTYWRMYGVKQLDYGWIAKGVPLAWKVMGARRLSASGTWTCYGIIRRLETWFTGA